MTISFTFSETIIFACNLYLMYRNVNFCFLLFKLCLHYTYLQKVKMPVNFSITYKNMKAKCNFYHSGKKFVESVPLSTMKQEDKIPLVVLVMPLRIHESWCSKSLCHRVSNTVVSQGIR